MNRLSIILNDPLYVRSVARTSIKEQDRKFCRHTFQHYLDVARITYILMLESGDIHKFMDKYGFSIEQAKEIVYASAILHDVGRWREYETGEDHASASAELAQEILPQAGFDDLEIGIIIKAIAEHRSLAEGQSILGEHLFRADNLSRLCAYCDAHQECYKYDAMETGRNTIVY